MSLRLICAAMTALTVAAGAARADTVDAKTWYDRATSAFALGSYEEAATDYEAAFKLKPDAALLYDAAQAHRLGGNKERALTLYQNYLRVFGNRAANRAEVEEQVARLKRSLEDDRHLASSPPTSPVAPAPSTTASAPAPDLTAPPPSTSTPSEAAPSPSPSVTATTAPQHVSVVHKGWFWGVMAGVVVLVAAGVTAAVLATGGDRDPTPTFGSFTIRGM